jgi:tRNA threonylcarbamoyladenosine biosynthesis protein TsaB
MALILSLETSEKVCSIALSDGYNLSGTLDITEEKSHATMLTVLIEKIFSDKEIDIKKLDAVAISKGPGSYTGLRIGMSVAKGICYALNIPLISVNSLQILCIGLIQSGKLKNIGDSNSEIILCAVADAKRMEVYNALFNLNAEFISEIEATTINDNSYKEKLDSGVVVFFGSGVGKCKSVIQHQNACFIENFNPHASFMISLAFDSYLQKKFEDVAYFEPFYLKDFVATAPKRKIVTF